MEFFLKNKLVYFVPLILVALSIQAVFDKGADVYYYSVIIFVLGLISLKYHKFKVDRSLIIFCCSGFVFITLSYWLMGRFDQIPNKLVETYTNISNQYFWVVPLAFVPYLVVFFNKSEQYIFEPVFVFIFFLFAYVFYNSYILEFNRDLLSFFFNPIIIFDITFISLSFFALFYAFLKKGWISYIYLCLSLALIFVLILHGSRGTWLGLPIVLIAYFLHFYKFNLKKSLLMVLLSVFFVISNIVWDESPIKKRIKQLAEDKSQLIQENYQTSSGVRVFLWQESWKIFKENKLIGISSYGVEKHNCELNESGKLPVCFQHMHNIFFHELAANGVLGLLGLVFTYGAILYFFITKFLTYFNNFNVRGFSLLGIVYVLYYLICGLTEYYLFFVLPVYLHYFVILILAGFVLRYEAIIKK